MIAEILSGCLIVALVVVTIFEDRRRLEAKKALSKCQEDVKRLRYEVARVSEVLVPELHERVKQLEGKDEYDGYCDRRGQ